MALLTVKDLTKEYNGTKAADQISFHVNAGEIAALIGENGAGKTTILNCLQGSIKPTAGNIFYKSDSLLTKGCLKNEFGFLIQTNFFEYMNAYDNLDILLRLFGENSRRENEKKIMQALKLVGLEEKRNRYVKTFSFGMKQRLGLAQAFINTPNFLVLDEPFVGLDPIGKKILKKIIIDMAKENKAGILFSSHDLEDVSEICDKIIMLKKGKIVYNDKFRIKKLYCIKMERESEAVIISKNYEAVKQSCESIICSDFKKFQEIYQYTSEMGFKMKDIEIRENSLYEFFERSDKIEAIRD